MKTGKTITELATQVRDLSQRTQDYRLPQSVLEMTPDANLRVKPDRSTVDIRIAPNALFHSQLADKMGIPGRYYDRMRSEAPELLVRNVNHWLDAGGEKRFVRTSIEKPQQADLLTAPSPYATGRAFLGAAYKPLDNVDMLAALMPPLMHSGLEVKSSEITDTRLYLQLVTSRITAEVKKGDPIQLGLIVSNSEVGCGALSIQVLVYRLACLNGMIVGTDLPNFRKVHIGREFTASDDILQADTRKLRDAAIWAEARDVITAAVNQTTLDGVVERLKGIASNRIEDPQKAIEVVAKRFDLLEDEKNAVLKNLIEGGDLSQWGLTNAVTALAHNSSSYDRVVEIEAIGGKVAGMNLTEFARS